MSVALLELVWENNTELGGSELLVILALAWRADDEYRAWPSVKSVADRTRLSVRAVQYILRKLHEAGFIRIVEGRGRTKTSVYHVLIERFGSAEKVQQPLHLLNKEGSQEKVQNNAEKVQSATEKVQNPPIKGAIAVAPNKQRQTKDKQDRQSVAAKVAPARQCSIPDNFAPTPEMVAKAKVKYPNMNILEASETWANSMRANTQRYRYTSWDQAWWNGLAFAEQKGLHRKPEAQTNGQNRYANGVVRGHTGETKAGATTPDGRKLLSIDEALEASIAQVKGA